MNCIIVDDEPNAIDVLKRYVEQLPLLQLKGTFRNPLKALQFIQEEKIDLIFLDINMPNLSGTQLLRTLNSKPLVIFTTAYSEHAVESYELDAVDYLVKPILLERFLKAVNKAHDIFRHRDKLPLQQEEIKHTTDTILLKSGTQVHRVNLSEILYIEKDGNYLVVHLMDRKILIRANMNDIFSWLPESRFCRIHKSFIAAMDRIETIEAHQVTINKKPVPLGATYREEFLRKMNS